MREDASTQLLEEIMAVADGRLLSVSPPGFKTGRFGKPFTWGLGGTHRIPGDQHDVIGLRLPRGKDGMRMWSALLGAKLADAGQLYVAAPNNEGGKSAGSWLEELFDDVQTVQTRKKCRVWKVAGPKTRPTLEDFRIQVTDGVDALKLTVCSYPGLFAHGRLDPATKLLMRQLPELSGRVCDFACGAGFLSASIAAQSAEVELVGVDIDALALHAYRQNVPNAEAISLSRLPKGEFHHIVSNPPLHQGRHSNLQVIRDLVANATSHLRNKGTLWITTQGAVPCRPWLTEAFKNVDVIASTNRFKVWRASGFSRKRR